MKSIIASSPSPQPPLTHVPPLQGQSFRRPPPIASPRDPEAHPPPTINAHVTHNIVCGGGKAIETSVARSLGCGLTFCRSGLFSPPPSCSLHLPTSVLQNSNYTNHGLTQLNTLELDPIEASDHGLSV